MKRVLCKQEDLSLGSRHPQNSQVCGCQVCVCNSGTREMREQKQQETPWCSTDSLSLSELQIPSHKTRWREVEEAYPALISGSHVHYIHRHKTIHKK